jgi:hydrogenase-4 component F
VIPLALLVVWPVACIAVAAVLPRPRAVLGLGVVGSLVQVGLFAGVARAGFAGRTLGVGEQLLLDPLSAFHLALVVTVFAMSSIYACYSFAPQLASGQLTRRKARRFGAAWFAFLGSMTTMLLANHVGLMWMAMEATTLASAVLICLEFDRPSLQAAWAYLLICSVGIALALLGTFLLCGEARAAAGGGDPFLWTHLSELAPRMRAAPVHLAFLFLLVGYGTKAGLAPMHTWLPAAHSQAPSPVSAVLSGVLLNCAIYCISRFVPIVEGATADAGWALGLLVPFGLVSIGVAAAFIVGEHDIKRLLAFSSVEHMGVIALGIGVGGGTAALFHTLNHSVGKMLSFFCAGTLAQRFGTRDMRQMRGILTVGSSAGAGVVLGILALVGLPPFSIFMSELWIVKVGIGGGRYWTVAAFLVGAGVVFVAAIRHAVEMVWKRPGEGREPVAPARLGWPLVVLPLAVLLTLGVWMPPVVLRALESAAAVIQGRP